MDSLKGVRSPHLLAVSCHVSYQHEMHARRKQAVLLEQCLSQAGHCCSICTVGGMSGSGAVVFIRREQLPPVCLRCSVTSVPWKSPCLYLSGILDAWSLPVAGRQVMA